MNTVTAKVARRAALAIEMGQVFIEFKETSGCPPIAQVFNKRGHACSVGLVADVMRELGLRAVQSRAYRVTTTHGEGDDYPDDLLGRDFTADEPGTRLVGTSRICVRSMAGATWRLLSIWSRAWWWVGRSPSRCAPRW